MITAEDNSVWRAESRECCPSTQCRYRLGMTTATAGHLSRFFATPASLGLLGYELGVPSETLEGKKCDRSKTAGHGYQMERVNWSLLHRWLNEHVVDDAFLQANTILLLVDTNKLSSYDFFKGQTGKLIHQRLRYMRTERWHAVFVHACEHNGLSSTSHIQLYNYTMCVRTMLRTLA